MFEALFSVLAILNFQSLAAPISSFEIDNPRWTISKLNGGTSFADGANCYNATLTAKGYSDYLMYSDPTEIQYFLSNFCTKNNGVKRDGDVLVVQRYNLKHAGINLRDGFIFEKRNNEGKDQRRNTFSNTGAYSIKEFSDSTQFGYCNDSSCSVDAYSCQDTSTVRAAVKNCEVLSQNLGIAHAQAILQQFTMNPKRDLSTAGDLFMQVKQIQHNLKLMLATEECEIYALVKAASVVGHLQLLNYKDYRAWAQQTSDLKKEVNALRIKLEGKFGKVEKYKKVFQESQWLDGPIRYE